VKFDDPAGALVFPSSAIGNDNVGKMLVEHFSALENPRCAGKVGRRPIDILDVRSMR
jgi:hypothetical protein